MSKTTILVERKTRRLLKQIGIKGQTYDEIIGKLIKIKITQDLLDNELERQHSTNSHRS
jgi:hypothetical protein